MANREKGEVSLSVGGKPYTLVLTTNAMVQLEDLFSTADKELTFQQVLEKVSAGSVRHIRGFVWAALQEHHPAMTVKDAGEFITEAGGLIAFSAQLQALTESTTPDQQDLDDLGVSPNPPKARAMRKSRGTGGRSTSPHAAQV